MVTIYVSETALVTLTGTCECPWTTLVWKIEPKTVQLIAGIKKTGIVRVRTVS